MCKLFAIADTSMMSREQVEKAVFAVSTEFATSQKDGFGFAVCGRDGKRYVERYVAPSDFIGIGRLPAALASLGWMTDHVSTGWHGVASDKSWGEFQHAGPLIAHGRTSTNRVNLDNTHPFSKEGWLLAHNGVVDWIGPKTLPCLSSCDSEHLLNCYVYGKGTRDFADCLTGWFATVTIDPDGRLRVAKDAATELVVAWSSAWDTFVFATDTAVTSRLNILADAKLSRPLPLDPYIEIVFEGNMKKELVSFPIPDTSAAFQDMASTALGRAVTSPSTPGATPAVPVLCGVPATPVAATTAMNTGFAKPPEPQGRAPRKMPVRFAVERLDWDNASLNELLDLANYVFPLVENEVPDSPDEPAEPAARREVPA